MMRKVVRWSPGVVVGFLAFVVHTSVTGAWARLNHERRIRRVGGTNASYEPTPEKR